MASADWRTLQRAPPPPLPTTAPGIGMASAEKRTRQQAPPPPLPTTAPPPVTRRPDGVAIAQGSADRRRHPPSLRTLATTRMLAADSAKRAAPPPLETLQRRRAAPPALETLQRSTPTSRTIARQAGPRPRGMEVVENPLSTGLGGSGASSHAEIEDIETPDGEGVGRIGRAHRKPMIAADTGEDLTAKQLRDGGRKMKRDAHEACFDSFDLNNDNSLSLSELGLAFAQLGLVLSAADLEALKDKYDEDGDDCLSKREFLHMVDDFMESAPQTFSADDWCPATVCCCSLDCINWGHRSTQMDNGDLSTIGSAGPCGVSRLSSSVNVCIEMPKAKWMHVIVGPTGLRQLYMYMWESVITCVVVITGSVIAQPHRTGVAASAALVIGLGWASFRTSMFVFRRRGAATVFAAGNPIDAPKGCFPLSAVDAEEAVNHFLRCKGVKLGESHSLLQAKGHEAVETTQKLLQPQALACPACCGADWLQHVEGCTGRNAKRKPAIKAPHVTVFSRDQFSSICRRERHQLEVGESFYRIKRFPALASLRCQLQRREWMAGQVRDIGWVHTARYGRDIFRLLWWIFQGLCWSVLVSLLVSMIAPHLVGDESAYAVCSHHPVCDDVEFTGGVEVTTGHCSAECFYRCSDMICGGSAATCHHTDDGVCDEPFVCVPGTDSHDCHECNHLIVYFVEGIRREYLATTNNSKCDEPYDCRYGTDALDCGNDIARATCIYHDDGHCDEPHLVAGKLQHGPCAKGSDYMDCLYDSEADRLLGDQRLYVLELERMYSENHDFGWLSIVADESIKRCQLESDDGGHSCVPQACTDVTILEKCSGCVNASIHPEFGDARCAPGLLDYPDNTVLCKEAVRAGQIANAQWCHPRYHSDGRVPCQCMTIWEKWHPSPGLFWSFFVVLWSLILLLTFGFWMMYVPAFVEFGHPGMGTITGRPRDHGAWAYIEGLPAYRNRVTMTLLQEKLGRHPSPDILRAGWTHKPFLKHLLTGYSETMVIRKDTVSLVTKSGVSVPCCRSCVGDSHEYTVLLQDTNFIEIGAELHPVFYSIAIAFLTFSIALFFSSFLTGGVQASLLAGVCDWRGGGGEWSEECDDVWSIRPWSQAEIDNTKWFVLSFHNHRPILSRA